MRRAIRRPWALPLVPLYAAAVAGKNALYDAQIFGPKPLARPVISIGSLSAGGAGKTPVVIALADLLARHGIAADVLSRGYGRTSKAVKQVDPKGDSECFGDEPLEIARHGIPVFVGADRYAAGLLAERGRRSTLHLLDDGFQHRRLARTLDIVLVTLVDIGDRLLPAGNLREPPSSLRRAHAVILREDEAEALRPVVAAHTGAAIWIIRRSLTVASSSSRPFAFCGIARPESFFQMLTAAGCAPAGTLTFPDHHRYTPADLNRLAAAAPPADANGWITTAKDAVKLGLEERSSLESLGPIHIAELRVSFLDEAAVLARLALGAP